MFDFLKKSRTFKFLCSSCLICSLGAFANVCATEPTPSKISDTYVTGPIGVGENSITLTGSTVNAATGILTGTFKWKSETTYSNAGKSLTGKTMSKIISSLTANDLTLMGVTADLETFKSTTTSLSLEQLNSLDWTKDANKPTLESISNEDEDAKLEFYLLSGETQKGASREVGISDPTNAISVELYDKSSGAAANTDTTKISVVPGKYELKALVKSGSTTIFANPSA